jgi:protein involved in polysaccharide export with SLBB domain
MNNSIAVKHISRIRAGLAALCLLCGMACSSKEQAAQPATLSGDVAREEVLRLNRQGRELMNGLEQDDGADGIQRRKLVVQPGDRIEINLWLSDRVTQLSGFPVTRTVPDSGEIFLPHLGMVQAAGKTASAFKADIQRYFDELLSEAYIMVNLERERIAGSDSRTSVELGNHVVILGHVSRPGLYPISPGLRLRDGLALAGGFKHYANKNIFLVRGDIAHPEVLRVDMGDVLTGVNISQNVQLTANDAVYVAPKMLWKVSDFISTLLMPLVSVRDALWVIDRIE